MRTEVEQVERAHREHWGRVLAATRSSVGSLDLAEDATADAFEVALTAWPRDGVPANPAGWLVVTARRKAIDRLRRAETARRRLPLLSVDAEVLEPDPGDRLAEASDPDSPDAGPEWLPDDLLRLVFTCCHPALSPDARVPLTLRLVCGLPVVDIARVLLVAEPTIAARVTRAKRKIAAAGIPYRVPPPSDLPSRLDSVLTVVHAVFTAGYSAGPGSEVTRSEVTARALHLARALLTLMPHEAEVAGLLALLLLTQARSGGRVDADGTPVPLEEQDRSRWDPAGIADGLALLRSLSRRPAGRFVLQAAIAGEHARATTFEQTDWARIVRLYDALAVEWPSPLVELNRAAARTFTDGPGAALAEIDALATDPALADYPYLASSRADLLRRLGRTEEAAAAYRRALELGTSEPERRYLRQRLAELDS